MEGVKKSVIFASFFRLTRPEDSRVRRGGGGGGGGDAFWGIL